MDQRHRGGASFRLELKRLPALYAQVHVCNVHCEYFLFARCVVVLNVAVVLVSFAKENVLTEVWTMIANQALRCELIRIISI